MSYNNENDYQALLSWLQPRLEEWRNHRDTNYLTKWDEYYRLWRGIWSSEDKSRKSEKSQLITPALQQAVEASVAELEEATFGRGKWFDIKDDMLDKNPQDAEYVRNLLQEDLEASGSKDAICETFLNGAIYGTGIAKIITEEKIERYPAEVPVEGTLTTTRQLQEKVAVDVRIEPISPKEFLIDPSANSINEALGVAHEVYKPRYVLNEGMDSGVYRTIDIEADVDVVKVGFDSEWNSKDTGDQIKICEYWGKVPAKYLNKKESTDDFEYNEDELVEAVITIANDQYILRAEENPFMMEDRPFIAYQHDIVPNKFWGRGVCEKGYNPQKALDAEMRARIDSLALTTVPMIAADATRLPRGIKLEVRPGKTILTNGDPRNAIMPLTLGQTDPQTIQQIGLLQNMVQIGTGSIDLGNASDRATAGGMSMAQSASIKRQKRTLMNFQNTFLVPMINKSLWRKIQFDVERYPVVDYKFIPYSTMGIMAKELEMQQMVSMLQSIPKDSPAFNILLLAVFQNSSIHNRDQIVNALMQGMQPNPEQQQMQQMQMQLEMEQKKADIQKTLAEAQDEQASAMNRAADVGMKQPNEIDVQERLVKLQKDMTSIKKTEAEIQSTQTDTFRTIPEMEHLKSETALNYANARRTKQQ
jgi:hypothetical protein